MYELSDDCDLLPNPHNFYMIDGGDVRPKIVSEKKGIISYGLENISCFVRKEDFEDASHFSEKEQAKYIARIKKLPPKYVKGTFTSAIFGFSGSEWLDSWVVKHHFADGKPDAPALFYQHMVPEWRE